MAKDDISAIVTYVAVMILIMAFACIFRFSFVFFLGPSPYGETYLSSGIVIIICILIICLVCYFLGGGFSGGEFKSSLSGKYYPPKTRHMCPKCNKKVKVIKKRHGFRTYNHCSICDYKFTSNSTDYKHGDEVRAMLNDKSGRYKRCPKCTSLVDMKIGICRFCGHDLINEESLPKKENPKKESEYVHCKICNHLIDVDFGICEYCGFDINNEREDKKQHEDIEHIDSNEDEKQSESVQCPICNNLIDVDFGICEYCGFDINKKDKPDEQREYVKCPICNNLIDVKYGICDFCDFEINDN